MLQAWAQVTEGQATIIASLVTLVAAIGGVFLGAVIFSNRLKTLEDAVGKSEEIVAGHVEGVQSQVKELSEVLNLQVAALSQQVAQVSGTISDAATEGPPEQHEEYEETTPFNRLSTAWAKIRDRLESIAANPDVDGRTRAKYGRIDRRQYWALVESLAADGELGDKAQQFRHALEIWMRFRSRRVNPIAQDAERLEQLADQLA